MSANLTVNAAAEVAKALKMSGKNSGLSRYIKASSDSIEYLGVKMSYSKFFTRDLFGIRDDVDFTPFVASGIVNMMSLMNLRNLDISKTAHDVAMRLIDSSSATDKLVCLSFVNCLDSGIKKARNRFSMVSDADFNSIEVMRTVMGCGISSGTNNAFIQPALLCSVAFDKSILVDMMIALWEPLNIAQFLTLRLDNKVGEPKGLGKQRNITDSAILSVRMASYFFRLICSDIAGYVLGGKLGGVLLDEDDELTKLRGVGIDVIDTLRSDNLANYVKTGDMQYIRQRLSRTHDTLDGYAFSGDKISEEDLECALVAKKLYGLRISDEVAVLRYLLSKPSRLAFQEPLAPTFYFLATPPSEVSQVLADTWRIKNSSKELKSAQSALSKHNSDLKVENRILKERVEELERGMDESVPHVELTELKNMRELNEALSREVVDLKREVEKYEKQQQYDSENFNDLLSQMAIYQDKLSEYENGGDSDLDDMIKFLSDKKIVLIGGHYDTKGKLDALGLSNIKQCVTSNELHRVQDVDYVIVSSTFVSHTLQFYARERFGDSNLFFFNGTNINLLIRTLYDCISSVLVK